MSEETIEEGIYSIAQEKLKLEQDLNEAGEEDGKKVKKEVSRLLKTVLDVDMNDKQLGNVKEVFAEL
jgi:hypothetical protein